jgi:hypothetical protein
METNLDVQLEHQAVELQGLLVKYPELLMAIGQPVGQDQKRFLAHVLRTAPGDYAALGTFGYKLF